MLVALARVSATTQVGTAAETREKPFTLRGCRADSHCQGASDAAIFRAVSYVHAYAMIFATDLEKVALFYTEILQLHQREVFDDFIELADDEAVEIAVHRSHAEAGVSTWRSDVAIKPCFVIRDLDAALARLEASAGTAREPWVWNDRRHCDCADPEGNVFQLVEAKPSS